MTWNRYFSGKSWYQGTTDPDSFDSGILNQNERDNLRMLQKAEEGEDRVRDPQNRHGGISKDRWFHGHPSLSQAIYRMATGATEQEAGGYDPWKDHCGVDIPDPRRRWAGMGSGSCDRL